MVGPGVVVGSKANVVVASGQLLLGSSLVWPMAAIVVANGQK